MEKEEEKQVQENNPDNQDISQSKYFWIIGAVLLLIVGWFSWKLIFGSEDYKVSLVYAPNESAAGSNIAFTWRVDGPAAVINHTSVHYGTVSTPGILEKNVKPGDTKYTDFVKDFADGKFNVPLQFVGNTVINVPGKYYFRVHMAVKDNNFWSDEFTIEIKPAGDYQISLLTAPKEINSGDVATFTWRIDGVPVTINHTSVHLGTISTPGKLGKNIKPANTKYEDLVKDFANGKFGIPLQFVGNAKIATPGAYFYRAHAIINGQNYWTDEGTLEVK